MTCLAPKVLHATAWYPPYGVGGTEVYIAELTRELRALNIESTVVVPRHPRAPSTYLDAQARVTTYPVNEIPAPGEMRRHKPHLQFDQFKTHLLSHGDAIYHQHSWTRGCGPHHLQCARELGFRTVLTVHVPANICLRGTMLEMGKIACNGQVDEVKCGVCYLHSKGLSRTLSRPLVALPRPWAERAWRKNGRIATALAARILVSEKKETLRSMMTNADRIVVVCQWLRRALIANGAPEHKLVLSRQGVSGAYQEQAWAAAKERPHGSGPLKLLYLGRWETVKGIHFVVRAMRLLADEVDVRLTIHAASNTADDSRYEALVRSLSEGDSRIDIRPMVARQDIAAVMARHDALVVPSVWLETGPLVVLEAQAAGLFVLGSHLGGISELIAKTDEGKLVEAGNPLAWAEAIRSLSIAHKNDRLPHQPRHVRSMREVASDMAELYSDLQPRSGTIHSKGDNTQ
jgi:glycosyltransferase involved in cell wall biosynthesis